MKKAAVSVIFIVLLSCPAFADEKVPAILVRGPLPHQGIEFLGVNTVEAEYGEYIYRDDQIVLYYTTADIYLSEEWEPADCSESGVRSYTGKDDTGRSVIVYSDKRGWHAFISFPEKADYICAFAGAYISRQNYFNNIAYDETLFSFPAILDIEQ